MRTRYYSSSAAFLASVLMLFAFSEAALAAPPPGAVPPMALPKVAPPSVPAPAGATPAPGAPVAAPVPVTSAPSAAAPAPRKTKPRPAPKPVPVVHPAPASEATNQELEALRAQLAALREELKGVVGTPQASAAPPAVDPDREALEAKLLQEKKNLAGIEAAVAAGLDPSAVADSIAKTRARIEELETRLQPKPVSAPPPTRSLADVSAAIERLEAKLVELSVRADAREDEEAAARTAAVKAALAAAAEAKATAAEAERARREGQEKMELLPLEFTAFGDFYYAFARPGADDFGVGAVEVDASLNLTPYVLVSTAIVYSGQDEAFGLGAFVIDCGLAGEGEGYLVPSKALAKSGISFGRFDVPFGIAYLEYPAVSNRLISTPQAVSLTHDSWNDLGVQAYALSEYWTAIAYVVNGPALPADPATDPAAPEPEPTPGVSAVGGRVSGKLDGLLEVGGSAAVDIGDADRMMTFLGGDVSTALSKLDLRGEYLLKDVAVAGEPDLTHGVYARASLDLHPAFLVGRYDTVLTSLETLDRRVAAGATVEVFPQGEIRAVYEQSLDSDVRMVTVQLVGGSTFQPTGLRR